jgi:putative ABC transport system substrate-binding protein
VEFAAKSRLPAIYYKREFVEAGGLMSYAANPNDLARRTATYVDKILKGAKPAKHVRRGAYYVDRILRGTKPAELPVEQPIKFELVINLKTAKQIGLTIPPNVLVRADRVTK